MRGRWGPEQGLCEHGHGDPSHFLGESVREIGSFGHERLRRSRSLVELGCGGALPAGEEPASKPQAQRSLERTHIEKNERLLRMVPNRQGT